MTPKCSFKKEGSPCTSTAVGYVVNAKDDPACATHYDDAQLDGLFCYQLDEQICPACEGRSFFRRRVCETCKNSGVVSAELKGHDDGTGWKPCGECNGSGQVRARRGRPFGSTNRRPVPSAPAAVAA